MKIIAIFISTIVYSLNVSAQAGLTTVEGGVNATSSNFFLAKLKDGQAVDVFNADIYAGVEGSPYFSDDWTYASITLEDNRKFDSILIRLNLYENKINFKDENGHQKMLAANVKEIEIRDKSSKWNNTVFMTGYGEDRNTFFQALSDDGKKTRLFKRMNIIIAEKKIFNAPPEKKFELQERFYIFSKGVWYAESKNCSTLMTAFGNDSKINSFISANNIKCNKEKDLKQVIDYYNSY